MGNYSNIQVRQDEFVIRCLLFLCMVRAEPIVLSSVPARIEVFMLGGTHFTSIFDLEVVTIVKLRPIKSGRHGVLRISSMASISILLVFQITELLQMITKTILTQVTEMSRRLV